MRAKFGIGVTICALLLGATLGFKPEVAEASSICIQGAGAVSYQIRYNVVGDDIQIGGVRISPSAHNVPISGSAYINSSGGIIIGFNELLDYSTGGWAQPGGTTVIKISGGTITYDTTYYGNGTPITLNGAASVVSCSASVSSTSTASSAADPNVRPGAAVPVTTSGATGQADPNVRTGAAPNVGTSSAPTQGDPNVR